MQMVAWILISCLKSEIKYGNSEDLPTCYFSSSHVSTRDKFHAKRHKPGGLLHDVEIDVLPQQRRSIYKQVTEYSNACIYQNNQIYKAYAVFTTYRFLAQECIRMVEFTVLVFSGSIRHFASWAEKSRQTAIRNHSHTTLRICRNHNRPTVLYMAMSIHE